MAKPTAINLLREQQTHYVDTFLQWALTTGRFLIILTETIALGAFAYRFTLDRQIIDLADSIKNNSAIVSLYRDEPKYRNLHERLDFASTIASPFTDKALLLQTLVETARGKVIFEKVSINEKTIHLDVISSSTGALSSFLDNLKAIPALRNVTVDKVENKAGTGEIIIGITADLHEQHRGGTNETQ